MVPFTKETTFFYPEVVYLKKNGLFVMFSIFKNTGNDRIFVPLNQRPEFLTN